ncbi:long-chain-fatty-acid--CoA ligase [Desulfosarcina widdelii]|uniref:Long-chain-fatty-acid--CoA ligase n=1 Tax=Desulfosarcina widdelii TaxID=947919 RepID=A0A5K7Z0K6_9BACT|nr:long-chain fatty acid--CoA ligase [Desulfosarcina widdelii]BBO74190.1 long-chain-fatty-acid--CoA ligase [Desulfosarcina widdelii]
MKTTINQVFRNRVAKYNNRLAVEKKRNGRWESASWTQYYDSARSVGLGLLALGVKKGDRVALLSENRLEWLYTDMGALGIGACLVPIYTTLTADEVAYIVGNAEVKILVVEDSVQVEKALYAAEQCPALKTIVAMDGNGPKNDKLISFSELMQLGSKARKNDPEAFEKLAGAVAPEDLATIVYTSGTTGLPKGAMITHKNIMAVIDSLDRIKPEFAHDADQAVPFLPLSHVFERAAGHFYGMYKGITSSYAESVNTVLEDFGEKRPTIILAVPRVCEKVYQKILMQVEQQPAWRRKIFYWGHAIGARISTLREEKKPIPALLKLKYRLAYNLIFKKLQEALGGRVRWMTASGAPTARDIVLFFNAAGIQVVEGYGMTECFAPATMSNLADYRIGTVGRPLPGVEIKLDEDGEILIRGDNVFKGYWKMPEETAETFTEDGFLRSGDIGSFDDAGFLMITDRKKNLIITSGGKNIAPQKIENLFLSDPLFTHFIVIGERRKFLSALLTINLEQAEVIAQKRGIDCSDLDGLLDNPVFMRIIDEHVAERNSHLARFETIKRYRIIKNEFSQEAGELTPSLKIKRNVIQENYTDLIESMYADVN